MTKDISAIHSDPTGNESTLIKTPENNTKQITKGGAIYYPISISLAIVPKNNPKELAVYANNMRIPAKEIKLSNPGLSPTI